jgi:hypothetical protein
MSGTETFEQETFVAAATVTVDVRVGDIWAVWVDVSHWTNWDDGIEKIQLHGNFKQGNTFTLEPKGADPVECTLVSVSQGEEFVDEAVLPFGTIRTRHHLEPVGDRVKITHEQVAEVAAAAGFFGTQVWPGLQRGLAESLLNLADIVGN